MFNLVEDVAGKRNRNSIENRFNKYIEPSFKKLLHYDNLVWNEVEDTIFRAITGTGLKDTTCRSIAFWITYVLKWFF